jgi:ribosomal 50S subunit-recycling heat shock protein
MRIDDYLSTVGIVKRRTIAKQLAQNGLVTVNGRAVKAAYDVKVSDLIQIKGTRPFSAEILDVPTRSVPKEERDKYFKELPAG